MSEIVDLRRRSFLKGSAAAAAATAMATSSAFAFGAYEEAKNEKELKEEEIKNATFTPNVCGMCVNMCGVIVRNVDGVVKKIDPNPLYPKSRNFMCARGNAGIAEEYDPDRITTPLIRVGKKGEGKFRFLLDNELRKVELVRRYDGLEQFRFELLVEEFGEFFVLELLLHLLFDLVHRRVFVVWQKCQSKR
jgi:hypothetical protein